MSAVTLDVALYLVILLGALLLFSKDIIPTEISSIVILLALVLTGILTKEEAFRGFGSDTIVMIGSLFVLMAGLSKSGVITKLEEILTDLGKQRRSQSFLFMLVVAAAFSAFLSNAATMAAFLPVVVSLAQGFHESPKKWLMPVAYAVVLGGTVTLLGTSTTILVSGLLPKYGLPEFGLFTTTPVGLPLALFGLLYLWVASRYLLPESPDVDALSIDVKYDMRAYSTEVVVLPESPLCKVSIENSALFNEADVTVLGVVREGFPLLSPNPARVIREGDRLVVEGNIRKLTEITGKYGLKFLEELKIGQKDPSASEKKVEDAIEFHEILVTPRSLLCNRTPAEIDLRKRYRLSLLAINRQGVTIREKLSDVRIEAGDILVVQFLAYVDNSILDYLGLAALQFVRHERHRTSSALAAVIIFLGSLVLGSATSVPLSLSCLCGAVLLVICKVLRAQEFYEAIDVRLLLFLGSIIALGEGMRASGTAVALGDVLSQAFEVVNPLYGLMFFFLVTVLLTQLLSNQATVVIMIPLAISTAQKLGLNPMSFVMCVTVGASCGFLTPLEPVYMIVYGPGEYKFGDFFRLGILLTVLSMVVAMAIIPQVWPL